MGNLWSQSFPPAAKFTEKNLPDQAGKVMDSSYLAFVGLS